ncbi:MAG: segregation/condensation protein A, partial [Anaerolineaceae bacterium]|nr:segregation/condensation protein A [Anaerolineaceae bacterium]
MGIQLNNRTATNYLIATEVYEGPLDLLLELIEKAELDITKVALAQVTDQYLVYLSQIQERDPIEVSAFLVIAAKLIQIKSAALLPKPTLDPSLQPEEDPGEALARQLIIYKRFKELASHLAAREEQNLHTFLRLSSSPNIFASKFDLSDITLEDLVSAASEIFATGGNLPPLSSVVNMPRVTIREKISMILLRLKDGPVSFKQMFTHKNSRVDIVVTFLAMLELIKRHIVDAEQTDLFGDITLIPEKVL